MYENETLKIARCVASLAAAIHQAGGAADFVLPRIETDSAARLIEMLACNHIYFVYKNPKNKEESK